MINGKFSPTVVVSWTGLCRMLRNMSAFFEWTGLPVKRVILLRVSLIKSDITEEYSRDEKNDRTLHGVYTLRLGIDMVSLK
jgi:hypothetical protein